METLNKDRTSRVAIDDCSLVERAAIYSLCASEAIDEVVLLGPSSNEFRRDVLNLFSLAPSEHSASIIADDLPSAATADIAVIATKPIRDIRERVRMFVDAGFRGVFIVISEPVELMTWLAYDASRFPANKIIGLPVAETDRRKNSVVWCTGRSFGTTFVDFCKPDCPFFEGVAHRANESNEAPGSLLPIPAICVTRVCEAIFRDERIVLPLITPERYRNRVQKKACIVGRGGVETILDVQFEDDRPLGLRHESFVRAWVGLERPASRSLVGKHLLQSRYP
jgi:malate/lactate dehydrogenase